jgi:hypothetical protein
MAMPANNGITISNYSKCNNKGANKKLESRKKSKRYDLYAGEDFYVSGDEEDCKIGQKVISKKYILHIKAGETVSITYDPERQYKKGNFIVGLMNESGDEIETFRKLGKVRNQTKKIKVSKAGIYYFYFCPKKANDKDGTMEFRFDVAIHKKKAGSNTKTEINTVNNTVARQRNIVKQKSIKKDYDSVKTYRLKIADAPVKIQKWVKKCNSSNKIYFIKYKKRYFVYTNVIEDGNDFEFHIKVKGNNKIANLTIKPDKKMSGDGYALLSVPKYKKLTITCEDCSVKIGK